MAPDRKEPPHWSLLIAQPVEATHPHREGEPTYHFAPSMLRSEESSMGLVATLHRWDEGKRSVWIIFIERGEPVIKKAIWSEGSI